MDIEALTIFAEAAHLGSFAKVARKLNTDPSQISRTISSLETQLGVRLFQRTTRKIALTEAGKRYLDRISPVLIELQQAHDEITSMTSAPRGHLKITASVSYGQKCLLPLLSEFSETYPDITLELLLTDQNLDLVSNDIDFAIRMAPIIENDVICTKLHDTHYRVVASPTYLATADAITKPADITNHKMILFSLPDYRSEWQFKTKDGHISSVPVNGTLMISNAIAIQECVHKNMGIALLADWQVDRAIKEDQLINLFPDYRVAATTFETAAWIIYPNRNFLPNKTRVAIDFIRRRLNSLT
ncbi:LysR family transcriptional regulator [Kiloniella litopenaei]|uniref:LysR family transcriptional regulator n=1 Tax=Kiloniella litopenaei TaxID=1549748 RepID=A0A0M2R569_9PROT|nr:LysR family transcriptional regulator [Kiloniella litopenaei]KKJ75594.1 LysR family transcriptional regulator [Kiloniella litopenaei]